MNTLTNKLDLMIDIKPKAKIALYYPFFLGGGAEAVGLWILESLKDRYDVTIFTFCHLDFAKLNAMYETDLSYDSISIKAICPSIFKQILMLFISNSQDIRYFFIHLILKVLKDNKDNYDVLISGYNAADLGKPGIHYIHWVSVLESTKKIYQQISKFSLEAVSNNTSIANSQTVANYADSIYNNKSRVIYPPVVLQVGKNKWETKENAFICSGRLVNEKGPHRAISILQKVRERGFDVKLYITGGGGGLYAWKYQRFLRQMVKENADWVTLCENLPYAQYTAILYKCKYGIHLKPEPFGICIAEMVKAGAIPFVKKEGGQVEIVGAKNEELFFESMEEAIEKIVYILSDMSLEKKLRESLEQQKQLFSKERFTEEFLEVVKEFIEDKK